MLRLDPSGNQFEDIASISLEVADFDVLSSITTPHFVIKQQLTFDNLSDPR